MDGFEEQFSDEQPWFDAEDYQDGHDQEVSNLVNLPWRVTPLPW